MNESLRDNQNPDGGWPYRPGGASWTEPTVFALLAGYASSDSTGRSRALEWLRKLQCPDGGWSPKPGVTHSTWVTALAALLPPEDLGAALHAQAVRWLLGLTPANTSLYFRFKSWLNGNTAGDPNEGWPWVPGTAAWTTPTAIATLALAKENRRNPDPVVTRRITGARKFLLAHRCPDDGWNHGSIRAVGVDAVSYPETTGTALLALARSDAAAITPSIARAEAWWDSCPSSEAASWLMLGLRASGHAKAAPPASLKPRNIQDAALRIIAAAGDRGTEIFLA
jgi:hypothetical protein